MTVDGASVSILPGPPARVMAVVAPVVAVVLVGVRAASSGLSATGDDPVSPWIVAVLTVAAGAWLGWRSVTQHAVLGESTLWCRNLVTTFDVEWDRVEDLEVMRRGPVVVVEIRVRSMRRRHRLGAATRFPGENGEAVLDVVAAHPVAGALLVDDRP